MTNQSSDVYYRPTLFSRLIAAMMAQCKLSQTSLAGEANMSSSMIGCIKRGERVPVLEKLPDLAAALARLSGEPVTHQDLAYAIAVTAWGPGWLQQLIDRGISPKPELAIAIGQAQVRLGLLAFVKVCQALNLRAEDLYTAQLGYLSAEDEAKAVLWLLEETTIDRLLEQLKNRTIQGQPTHFSSMPEIPADLPHLPSYISSLLIRLLEETNLDREALAKALKVPVSRIEQLIVSRPEMSAAEYGAIASLVNHHFGLDYNAKTLKETKDFWDDVAGKTNENGVG